MTRTEKSFKDFLKAGVKSVSDGLSKDSAFILALNKTNVIIIPFLIFFFLWVGDLAIERNIIILLVFGGLWIWNLKEWYQRWKGGERYA